MCSLAALRGRFHVSRSELGAYAIPKAAATPARIAVGAKTEAMTVREHAQRGEAADRL